MADPGPDVELVDRLLPALRRREPEAFHELHGRLAGSLVAYAHARLGDRSAAEDVVQDVFVRLTRHVRRFRGDGRALLAWLYTTTRNRCADVHRRRGRRRETPVAQLPEAVAGPSAPPAGVTDPDLLAALERLTDEQREALLLRRVAGLDGSEVAEVMGRDRDAVYALCARAESRLRELLRDGGVGHD